MKKVCALLLCVCLAGALLSGCGRTEAPSSGLKVVATCYAPYDFARRLLGDRGEAELLLPPGAEVHTFEPSPRDILDIQNCGLFVYVGGESDAWVRNILDGMDSPPPAVTLMDCVDTLYEEETVAGMESEEEPAGGTDAGAEYDEHVWTSPRNAILICRKLCEALCAADPAGETEYRANLASYTAELEALDAAFTQVVADGARKTLVFADRFPLRYFVEAYGLSYYAAWPGCADDAEPSAATVAFLIDRVREEHIPVVFHIELSNEDMADTVCGETGAKKLQWNACHNVTRAQFDAGVTYLDLMWENVDSLKEALS